MLRGCVLLPLAANDFGQHVVVAGQALELMLPEGLVFSFRRKYILQQHNGVRLGRLQGNTDYVVLITPHVQQLHSLRFPLGSSIRHLESEFLCDGQVCSLSKGPVRVLVDELALLLGCQQPQLQR